MAVGKGLSVREAALRAKCHEETLRRWIRRGELLAKREPLGVGRRMLIDPMDLAAFLEKRRRV